MIEAVIIIGIKAEFRALIKRVKFLLIPNPLKKSKVGFRSIIFDIHLTL